MCAQVLYSLAYFYTDLENTDVHISRRSKHMEYMNAGQISRYRRVSWE